MHLPSALAAIICLALAAAGLAAPAPADAEEAPARWSLLDRTALTGDWDGRRSRWAARGVELDLQHYGDLAAVVDGGVERGTFYAGLVEAGAMLDLEALLGWPDTRVLVLGIGTFGRDPAAGTGSLHAPSNLANVATAKLLEAWVERGFFDRRLAVLAGLYAVDSEFDVKETAAVFVNGGFGTGLDLSETGLNGPCAYPTTCLGLRLRYQPDENRYLQLAVLDGVAGDPEDPRGTQIILAADDGVLLLGELGIQRDAAEGRFLRAALGAWHYTADFDDLLARDPAGLPRQRQGTQGLYALLEGNLYREPGQHTQGLAGFLRLGWADSSVNPIARYAGAGLVYTGLLPRRGEDVVGLGVSAAFNGSRFETAQAGSGTPVEGHETAFELSYWMPVLPWLSLQLDLQHIVNPGSDPRLDNATLLGLRYQVTF